jgi:ribosome-associated translation inhibitor RaiA
MRISINDKQKQLGPAALERIVGRVESAFSKFNQHVVSADLIMQDVNGPRGGIDKKCQVMVNLRKMNPIVVSAQSTAVSKAIAEAITKAKRTTNRKIKRRSMRNTGRQSGLTLGYLS